MFYSIIVPCYNCDDTIARLLDSILDQNFPDLEVILVDDTDNHSFLKEVEPYKEKLNIKIVNTELKYHNPGNSRNQGLEVAQGDWVLFIDCDDTFRENALILFKSYIDTQYSPCYFAAVKQFHEDGTEYTKAEEYQAKHIVWTHGKCYNRQFLNDCGIRFKPDMKSCEDYWFNYMVLANIINQGLTYIDIPEYVYNWLWNPKSLSRSTLYFLSIKEHFYDHLEASLIPWTLIAYPNQTQGVFEWYM
jgi:glycosyltransferase involved in cell wall biosynthesis